MAGEGGAVELRPIAAADRPGWVACIEAAFGRRRPPGTEEGFLDEIGDEGTVAAFAAGDLVGTAAHLRLEMTLPGGRLLPVAFVVAVTVLPSHRRRGVMTGMMRRQLADLREAGLAAAVLTASEGGIYGRFGYGLATSSFDYELDKRSARLREAPGAVAGEVRLLSLTEAEAAVPALWDVARRLRPAEVSVPPNFWRFWFHGAANRGIVEERRFWAGWRDGGGGLQGFTEYQVVDVGPGSRDRAVSVELLAAATPEAYRGLAGYLLGLDLVSQLRIRHRPADEPLRHLLTDARQLRAARWADDVWVRPLDVAALLRARAYTPGLGTGPLRLLVHDELFPANGGAYRLSVDGEGNAEVEGPVPSGGGEIELDVAGLGSVVLGGRRFADLVHGGRARELASGAAWRADALFLAEREPFATISF